VFTCPRKLVGLAIPAYSPSVLHERAYLVTLKTARKILGAVKIVREERVAQAQCDEKILAG
jgi:hypothetical protein